jgi:hypothetical protein
MTLPAIRSSGTPRLWLGTSATTKSVQSEPEASELQCYPAGHGSTSPPGKNRFGSPLTSRCTFASLQGSRSGMAIKGDSFRSINTISRRGRYFFVSFTGRFACGWPETLLTH